MSVSQFQGEVQLSPVFCGTGVLIQGAGRQPHKAQAGLRGPRARLSSFPCLSTSNFSVAEASAWCICALIFNFSVTDVGSVGWDMFASGLQGGGQTWNSHTDTQWGHRVQWIWPRPPHPGLGRDMLITEWGVCFTSSSLRRALSLGKPTEAGVCPLGEVQGMTAVDDKHKVAF